MERQAGRRPVLAIIGSGGALEAAMEQQCIELGRLAISAGWRLVSGGLGGVMAAVSRGGRASAAWREGDIIGIIPGYDRTQANPFVDIVIPTGMQLGRNILVVSMADVVLAVGGGAGTLSEVALAWQLGKPIVAVQPMGGWAATLAGTCLDERHGEPIAAAEGAADALEQAQALVARASRDAGDIGSGWRRAP